MALYSGKTGFIKKGTGEHAKVIAHMSSFSLELSTDMIEVVSFGNTYKEKIPSIMDWSASAGQDDLIRAYNGGELITIGLGLKEGVYFEGTGYIESLSIENSSDESPTISIDLAGSNAIVFQNA